MSRETIIQLSDDDLWVAYSLPGSEEVLFMIGEKTDQQAGEPCFMLQAWDRQEEPRHYIIPKSIRRNTPWTYEVQEMCEVTSTRREDYERIIQRTVDAIRSGNIEKAVISKIKVVPRQEEDVHALYMSLVKRYPRAFTFMYNLPGEGTWCGATPEVLITAEGGHLRTMALAGTLPIDGQALSDIPWTPKERHEQGVIEDFIEEACGDLRLDFQKNGPTTIQAGAMAHIQSSYTITGSTEVQRLIDRLHPGPAICGRPQILAKDWIQAEEQHDRDHYCGFLGPWGIDNQQALFIHLRSMRIYKDHYVLYLGGGITADSDIIGEWDETELKAQTMLSVINATVHG